MAVRQLKGLHHCKLIKRRAKKMWQKTEWQKGMWDQCLRTAIENHRRQIAAELVSKRVQEQLKFSSAVIEWPDV